MDFLDALKLNEILDFAEDSDADQSSSHIRTLADVVDTPNSYVFAVDMPGLKRDQIKVHVEHDAVLVVSGERKRESYTKENEKKGKNKKKAAPVRYIRKERTFGKYLKKFILAEDSDRDKISAMYEDGILTVTVDKRPVPPPVEPKTIEVKIA